MGSSTGLAYIEAILWQPQGRSRQQDALLNRHRDWTFLYSSSCAIACCLLNVVTVLGCSTYLLCYLALGVMVYLMQTEELLKQATQVTCKVFVVVLIVITDVVLTGRRSAAPHDK